MKALYRRLRNRLRQWWECRTQRCSYYRHYLAYGPADMPHSTFHYVEDQADEHFLNCRYEGRYRDGFRPDGKIDLCPRCLHFEKQVRA